VAPTPRARKAAEANYIEAHGGLNLEMVWLPGGEFQMGSNDSDASGDEKPVHSVSLDGFWIGKYEVTQRQYEALMGSDPSRFKGADWPVDTVSWNNATAFCRKLSSVTGKAYLLPTEAQWEYACRAGSAGKWCFGSDESQLGKYAWFDRNSGSQTHPVGQKQPNAWRLFDMHGNVWEWCGDWYADSYSGALSERNPTGPNSGTFRVLRGGSWVSYPGGCRSAYRSWFGPGDRVGINGFRVVRTQK
jgi:formylglycine-generating enzyme required for sulfatase activity